MPVRAPRDERIEEGRWPAPGDAGPPRFSGHATFLTRRQPALFLTLAFALGILLDIFFHNGSASRGLASAACFISIALSALSVIRGKDSPATGFLLIGFIAAGSLLSHLERSRVAESRLKRLFDAGVITPSDPVALAGRLAMPPEPAPDAYYLYVDAESIQTRGGTRGATGRARLVVALTDEESVEDFNNLALDYGSRVRALVRLDRARVYANPGSVDFNDFLERDGCDLKGSVKSPLLISRQPDAPKNTALAFIYRARRALVRAIDARFDSFTGGTLKAVLVDNRFFLDEGAASRLREGGTFHIISISGMHVGILAWVLLGVFTGFSIKRTRLIGARVWKACLVLLALWSYAVMAGLAPPVVRATTMLTIALIAPLFFRRAASVNTLGLAAFIMLAFTPSLISDPGFQLSFVAVAAIVTVAAPIAARLEEVGEWRPSARAPHPPSVFRPVRVLAEALFWDERKFRREMKGSPVRYRMDKARAALLLGRLRVQPLARGVVLLIITSAAIQVMTLPLSALYFNRVTPVGVLLNVVTGLLTGVMMLASVCAMVIGSVSESLAAPLVSLVDLSHHLLVYSVEPFAGLPLASFRVAHYEGWRASIYGLYFVPVTLLLLAIDGWRPVDRVKFPLERLRAASRAGRSRGRSFLESVFDPFKRAALGPYALLPALLICSVGVMGRRPATPDGRLRIHFLDVGQGDSALVIFPGGSTMLIDAGGEAGFGAGETEGSGGRGPDSRRAFSVGEAVVSRFLWSLGYTRVDYLVATHGDADHIEGLSAVARNFDVGQSIIGRLVVAEPGKGAELQRFRQTISERAIPLGQVRAGQRFEVEGARVEIIWPPARASGSSSNNDSIVIRLVYGAFSALMTGDIEREAEARLTESRLNLRADVLKAPHHGSRTSSSEDFLKKVSPECVVISVGERSRFGHPHELVLDRYRRAGARLFQTGRDGMVTVSSDGSGFNVTSYKTARD